MAEELVVLMVLLMVLQPAVQLAKYLADRWGVMLDSTMDFVTADTKVENLVDGWVDQMD